MNQDTPFLRVVKATQITTLLDGSSGDVAWECEMLLLYLEGFELLKRRQKKYGPKNIARIKIAGCLSRLSDKMARLEAYFVDGRRGEAADEPIDGTLLDAMNYPLLALALRRGKWPGVPADPDYDPSVVIP